MQVEECKSPVSFEMTQPFVFEACRNALSFHKSSVKITESLWSLCHLLLAEAVKLYEKTSNYRRKLNASVKKEIRVEVSLAFRHIIQRKRKCKLSPAGICSVCHKQGKNISSTCLDKH